MGRRSPRGFRRTFDWWCVFAIDYLSRPARQENQPISMGVIEARVVTTWRSNDVCFSFMPKLPCFPADLRQIKFFFSVRIFGVWALQSGLSNPSVII
jgi:hypothetical protein